MELLKTDSYFKEAGDEFTLKKYAPKPFLMRIITTLFVLKIKVFEF